MTIRKRIPVILVLLAALALLAPAAAFAEAKYVPNTTFASQFKAAMETTNYYTNTKVSPKALPTMNSVAVDNSSSSSKGYIYVPISGSTPSDGEGVIDKFKVEGSGSAVKVTFDCALGGSNIEAASDPCASEPSKLAPEALTTLEEVAVGPNGEVYVANYTGLKVDEFNSAGEYVGQIPGTSSGAFVKLYNVAVGPNGEVYVGDYRSATESLLDKFEGGVFKYSIECGTKKETRGTIIESVCGTKTSWKLNSYAGLAVDSAGNVYATDYTSGDDVVDEFSSTGSYETQFTTTNAKLPEGIATEPATSTFFFGEGAAVEWYEAGALKESVAVTTPEALPRVARGLAATSSGALYVAEGPDKAIQMFELAEPPAVSGCTVSSITNSGAKLEGSVNPNGKETEYEFEYGTSTSYGNKTTKLSAGSGTSAVSEAATVTGLTPATKYDCRVYASSAGGEAHGANGEFTTKLAIEGVKTLPASSVAFESATMNGSLRPEGAPTVEYFIEYGQTTAYGHHTTVKTSSSSSEVAVSEALSGLTPLTTYHYRIVAKREIEGKTYSTYGSDVAFTTGGLPPGVIAESISGIGAFSATLEATINPGNSATTYWFEYGTSPTSEQAFIPAGTIAGDGNIIAAPETLQNLAPDTTYYYHVVAENSFGRVEGVEGSRGPEERSFTTLPAYAPEVALASVGGVGQTSAGVSLSVDPHGLATEYEVQLGEEGAYVPVVVQSAGAGEAPVQIGLALSALAPGSAYQVRVLAWNAAGEVTSTTQTFTTGASPAVALTQPVTPVLVSFTPPSIAKPPVTTTTTSKTKSLTKAQKLAKALKACKRDKAKSKRQACVRHARKEFGQSKKAKK